MAILAGAFARLGVEKLRITGGEPLLRRDIDALVRLLVAVPGIRDVALTTNGLLLPESAAALKEAGLHRITVSLDSLDDGVFGRMNGRGVGVAPVVAGIESAMAAGFRGIKLNMVVQKGVNDHEVVDMARRWRGTGVIVRFIEFMDVGTVNGWDLSQVVPSAEIVRQISEVMPLEPVEANYAGEVAERWRYGDGSGEEIGVISSVTQAFCSTCTRARLSAKGELFTCLFASAGTDLRDLVRSGAGLDDLVRFLGNVWRARTDRYSEVRLVDTAKRIASGEPLRRVEMSYIGG
jgi:cyclic pyranopterin phosphate synthase